MRLIEYQITYADGQTELRFVRARDINSGFSKALKMAKERLGDGTQREISRIEFWQVKS